MLKNLLGSNILSGEGDGLAAENAVTAAATSLLQVATDTMNSLEQQTPFSIQAASKQPQTAAITANSSGSGNNNNNNKRRIARFPLIDDDAGLLLSSEADPSFAPHHPASEVDEDELAGQMLVQFPSYGTQSQALNKDSSSQWQEKTADWLLGGTSSIPTPKQQQQKQQQQKQTNGSNLIPIAEDDNSMIAADGSGAGLQPKTNDGYDATAQELVNSRDWSVDEQLLWKSRKYPAPSGRQTRSDVAAAETGKSGGANRGPRPTFTTRNGEVLTLKDYDVAFEQPDLEDPVKDFMAAYYYHVGVMPQPVDRSKLDDTKRRAAIDDDESFGKENRVSRKQQQQLERLIRKHSFPYHVNDDIQKDLTSFGRIAALPDFSEEKDCCADDDCRHCCGPNGTAREPAEQRDGCRTVGISATNEIIGVSEVAWMPDRLCKTCYSCDAPFTVFRRRHHCRICGQVFCNACSAYFVPASSTTSSSKWPLVIMPQSPKRPGSSTPSKNKLLPSQPTTPHGKSGGGGSGGGSTVTLRACKMCYDQVTARQEQQKKLKSVESASAMAADRKQPRHSAESFGGNPVDSSAASTANPHKRGVRATSALASVLSTPIEGISSRLRDLQINHTDAEESTAFLRQWSKAIGAEGIASLATKTGLVRDDSDGIQKPSTLPRQTSHSSTASASSVDHPDRSRDTQEGNRHLGATAASHLEQMTASLLQSDAPVLWNELCAEQAAASNTETVETLRSKWINKLMSLATRCCATVDTSIKRGDMLDIRPYVKIKVIPGGTCDECTYMSGILFRKTGTNKQMPREIINPKIMLLSGGIEFTRNARISSLETLLEQEDKYIEILVGKILKLEPDLLIVGKGVSRRAQELLLKNNVQLLQQVKAPLLNRISRQTGATVISSTDHIMNQFGGHALGNCQRFRFIVARDNESWGNGDSRTSNEQRHIHALLRNKKLSNHERQAALAANMLGEDILDGSEAIQIGLAKRGVTQTFAVLEGCPKHLGCTIVLRGANKAALKQIKNVFRFLVSAAYNMKLEMSYLKERCARLRPDYTVQPKNLFSSSFCVDYGHPPNNRKIRPWNGGTNNEGIQRSISGRVTAFDHQSILITSVWMTDKTQCCPAEVKGICYYSMQDVSLGQFLRDSCFNLSLKCQNPSCKKSVLDHSLSFVHNDGLINIMVDLMDEPLPPAPAEYSRNMDNKNGDDDSEELDDSPIATWTYCNDCSEVVTPLIWLSANTWKYSFGKFLESFFYNRDTIVNSPQKSCKCQLQKSTTLYFGCGRLAAKFTYERIRPFGVYVRKSLPIDTAFHRSRALRHLEKISMASSTLFVNFDKHIEKVAREARSVKRLSDNHNLQTVIMELSRISNEVDHAAKTLQEKIASVSEKCLNEHEGAVNDAALFRFPWHARRFLFMLTSAWNEKLSAAGQAIVAMKKLSSSSHRNESGIGTNVPSIVAGDQNTEELNEGMRRLRQLHEVYSRYNLTDIHTVLPTIPGNADHRAIDTEFDDDFEDPDTSIDFSAEVDADVLASRRRLYNTPHSDTSRLGVRALSRVGELDRSTNSQIKQTPGATVKSAITRFFQRGGRERDPYVVNLGLFHEGRPRLEPGVNGIVVPVIDEQLSTVIAYSLSSKEYDNQFQNYSKIESSNLDTPDTPPGPSMRSQADSKHRNLPNNPQQNSSRGQPLSNMSGKKGIERRMLVRNKSHIKHTFRDLDEKGQNLCKFVCTTYWATQFHAVREAFLSQGSVSKDTTSLEIEKSFILSLSSAYSWAASGGKSGASFARTADDRFVIKCISRTELQMFLDCAPAYFEYLSKAFFHGLPTVLCKIVGVYQIGYHNRVTGKRSMEQVAVMQNIFYNKKISKIFDLKGSLRGRFAAQIKSHHEDQNNYSNIRNSRANSSDSVGGHRKYPSDSGDDDAYDDNSHSHYRDDITDSRRSKKEGPTAPRTLLDGDFLESTFGRPMPMHDRAKEIFHMSILNDTLFLSIINVLDYSILVGIDEEKMELVVGIIDFMRQYDILKQMERVGKSIPMVVGSEAPTIIQPPLYKARFTNAMERYFMTVPSKWTTI